MLMHIIKCQHISMGHVISKLNLFQHDSRLAFSSAFSYISFPSFTLPGLPYQIFLLYLFKLFSSILSCCKSSNNMLVRIICCRAQDNWKSLLKAQTKTFTLSDRFLLSAMNFPGKQQSTQLAD